MIKLWLVFGTIFLIYAFAPRHVGMGQASRIDLTQAIVDEGTFKINSYVHNTIDWSKRGEDYYINKAPGVSFLAVPFYWGMTRLQKAFQASDSDWWYRKLRWTDVFVTALPSVLLAWLLFLTLSCWCETSQALMATVTYSLGTIAFPFSTMLWGHQTAAALLFGSFYFLTINPRYFLCGTLFGLSVLSEYSCALAAPGFVYLWMKADHPRARSLGLIILGGLPWLGLFIFYHKVCFGGYFALAPHFQNEAFNNSEPVIGMPDPSALFKILFGLSRGLFLISPIFLLSVWGWRSWFKQVKIRPYLYFVIWIFVSFLLFNSSYNGWHGGGASGPRYLIPTLPFLAIGFAFIRLNGLFISLTVLSVIFSTAITAADTLASPEFSLFSHIFDLLKTSPTALKNFLKLLFVTLTLFTFSWFYQPASSSSRRTA